MMLAHIIDLNLSLWESRFKDMEPNRIDASLHIVDYAYFLPDGEFHVLFETRGGDYPSAVQKYEYRYVVNPF